MARMLLAEYDALRGSLPFDDPDLVQAELGLLDTFADICEISRPRPTEDEEEADEGVHSPREHFHSFLHSLDADVEALPPSFRDKLVRALRNYDVTTLSLERSWRKRSTGYSSHCSGWRTRSR